MDQRTRVKILTVLYNFKCVRRACSGNVLTYVLILLICKQLYNRTQRHHQSTQVALFLFSPVLASEYNQPEMIQYYRFSSHCKRVRIGGLLNKMSHKINY